MEKLNLSIEDLQLVNTELVSFKKELTQGVNVLTNGLKEDIFEASGEAMRHKLKKNKIALDEFQLETSQMIKKCDKVIEFTNRAIKEAQK